MQAHCKVCRLKLSRGNLLEQAAQASQPVGPNIVVNENYLV
jgi:hypothetical protein